MKNIMLKALLVLLILFGAYGPVKDALAIDPPHNVTNDISCTSLCHLSGSPLPAWRSQPTGTPTIDQTSANNLCKACHIPTYPMGPQAQDVQTHSSAQTSTTYGTWVIECRTCHDPHYQKQAAAYPISTLNSIVTGTVLTVAANGYSLTVTVSTAMTPSAYRDYILVPNTAYPTHLYRITDNSTTTIMVSPKNPFDPSFVKSNVRFVIRYPGLIKDQIDTPNSGTRTVRLFNSQGPKSFATNTTTMDGICQVCHTKTKYFTNDGTKLDRDHPASAGVNCTNCHSHKIGFKVSCNACHGNPPIVGTLGGTTGLAFNELGTGSTTPGAHQKHALILGYICDTCHSGGMPISRTYDKNIQMGFNILGAYQSGSYDGRSSLTNGYAYTAGNTETTVTQNGSMSCTSLYCHSQGTTSLPTFPAPNTVPTWSGTLPATCTGCHNGDRVSGATMATGSHTKHAVNVDLNCSKCHTATVSNDRTISNATNHVNKQVDIAFDEFSNPSGGAFYNGSLSPMTKTPGSAYGSCATVYCHGFTMDVGGDRNGGTNITPAWGNPAAGACGSCHGASLDNPPLRGSHVMHAGSNALGNGGRQIACTVCHYSYTTNHVNGSTNWTFNAVDYPWMSTARYRGALSGSLSPVPSSTYGQCSNLYCHSIVQTATGQALTGLPGEYKTPQWGNSATGECGTCHLADDGHIGQKINTGSHTRHLDYPFTTTLESTRCAICHKLNSAGTVNDCSACHTNEVNLHVNHQIDVAFETSLVGAGTYNGAPAPGNGYASCSNTYCHSNGTSLATSAIPSNTTFSWGATGPLSCASCHGNPPSYVSLNPKANSHIMHQPFTTCSTCHLATTTTGNSITNTANHVNGAYTVTPDPSKTFTYSSQTVTVNFTYAFDIGGGRCTNNSCHQARGVLYPVWGDNTGGVAVQVLCNKGDACYEGVCSAMVTGGQSPYTYFWDFGDGTTADTGSVGSVSHIFPSGTTNYNVVASVRDVFSRLGTENFWFTPQEAANIMPVAANSWVKNGYTVTITDLSSDPDYDDCGHSGPGMVNIWWTADWITAEKYLPLNLTDTPSNQTFSHTYSGPGTYRIIYDVYDNENNSGTGSRRPPDIYVTIP